MKYFTSDTHFGHANVIDYCKRPFANVLEMNHVMLSRLQQTLTDDDDLYFLGDWSMHQKYYSLLKAVPCRHFYFVLGNHDKAGKLAQQVDLDALESRLTIAKKMTTKIGDQDFFLVHRPVMASDNVPTLCGHVHEKWRVQPAGVEISEYKYRDVQAPKLLKQPVLNVGVDQHDFWPISEVEVVALVAQISGKS